MLFMSIVISQIGERGGTFIRARHAVRDIPSVWIHPRADSIRQPHRLHLHPVEAVLQWREGWQMLAL